MKRKIINLDDHLDCNSALRHNIENYLQMEYWTRLPGIRNSLARHQSSKKPVLPGSLATPPPFGMMPWAGDYCHRETTKTKNRHIIMLRATSEFPNYVHLKGSYSVFERPGKCPRGWRRGTCQPLPPAMGPQFPKPNIPTQRSQSKDPKLKIQS